MVIDCFDNEFAFLSNFYNINIKYEGLEYNSVEHAYQASKSLDINDRIKFTIIGNLTTGQSKRIGSKLTLRPNWDNIKLSIMEELLIIKFNNPTLKEALLLTSEYELIEGNNWHDNYWGFLYMSKMYIRRERK